MSKVFFRNFVVGFDEDFSENGFFNRVVFGIEFVKAMEGVFVLWEMGRFSYFRIFVYILI